MLEEVARIQCDWCPCSEGRLAKKGNTETTGADDGSTVVRDPVAEEPVPGCSQTNCFGYPLSIFFIVINEFCERFSYYGMRAILILYFQRFLGWNDNLGTAIYHTFVALCYMTPVLGALIADSWLGKFKTIVSLSIVYTIGQVVITVSSINDLTDFNHDGIPDNISVHV
ncbi:hypothetical protein J1605_005871 [Eschrichtius robustus]|uniref:Solute carrier family 15 member 1 n=1 Tax=Eschrichtius robustus TaxID=9764 RepID=A0AB34H8N9_ESCRO|nr:hypothetical protein J1605_005871 [Eschrichtius robustus]